MLSLWEIPKEILLLRKGDNNLKKDISVLFIKNIDC